MRSLLRRKTWLADGLPFSTRQPVEASLRAGFTLIELLVVTGIIVILLSLVIPIFAKKSSDVNKAVYDIQAALQIGRTYAVANRTYTWVGFFEEDVTQSSATPAVPGVGRLVMSIVASRDGTSIYDATAAAAGALTGPQTLAPTRLLQVGKLIQVENIHLFVPAVSVDAFGQRPGSRLSSTSDDRVGLGTAGAALLFKFQYPLSAPNAQYTFGTGPAVQAAGVTVPNGIVQFNPQGEAITETGPVPGVTPCKEIAIEATNGNAPAGDANVAAIDITGLTGQATIYRR